MDPRVETTNLQGKRGIRRACLLGSSVCHLSIAFRMPPNG